ncbi:AzlC family ABC transporter permease, partial [Pseudomonas sp.]|uniref:AzlC family ABC transporter permease n=1 Tax=Pseudomonas sp. TaxID=306 RepID=UPI002899DA68
MSSRQPIARTAFLHGAIAILPLSLAVAPWGLLAGSMAIEANLSPWEGQGLSAIVFAGAAQLVAIGMLKSGASLLSILLTTLLLTSQHLLYGLSMRPLLSGQPLCLRLGPGFLLTYSFFSLPSPYVHQPFTRCYSLGVGPTFYVSCTLFTFA